ncbi:MAG: hypothetical protein QM278_11735 [Pseudomonadota bacterium]|nr:hypothetical protein [Pseudomonadota bacterium]
MEIRSFLTGLLTRHDCLVEATEAADGTSLRVLFPPELQESLQVGELEVFELPRGEGRTLSLVHNGRDFIEALAPLALASGLYSALSFPGLTFPVADPEGFLASRLTVQNGIWRLREVRSENCGYLVVNFCLTATADTRSERLATVAVNARTGTIPLGLAAALSDLWERENGGRGPAAVSKAFSIRKEGKTPPIGTIAHSREAGGKQAQDAGGDDETVLPRVLAAARRQAALAAGEVFREFRTNLNRRLARDLTRLQGYYRTLAGEIEKRRRRKGHDPEEQERALSRLEATKADYLKKIRDARDKYALEILIEPVNALWVELPVTILEIALQRRKETRLFALPVNPLTRRPESPVCVRCQAPVLNFHLCDALHILCPACFPHCPVCNGKSP